MQAPNTIPAEQWEFCQVHLADRQEQKPGWKYDLSIVYAYPGQNRRALASVDRSGRVFTYNAFTAAMGLLGTFGWELVSVEHGTSYHGASSPHMGFAVAYFRRRIQRGRDIDQPPLVLP